MTRIRTMSVCGVAMGMAMMAGQVRADDFGFRLNINKGPAGKQVSVGLMFGNGPRVMPRPVVARPPVVIQPPVVVRPPVVIQPPVVVQPPVYRTVIERVWVPTVRTEYRDVPVYSSCGELVSYRREPYTVESGYWKEVERLVPVERPVAPPMAVNPPHMGRGPQPDRRPAPSHPSRFPVPGRGGQQWTGGRGLR